MAVDLPGRPRWGSFSVIDHLDTAALTTEILLYDKLVFPVPSSPQTRQRWEEQGRDPDLLDRRLAELGKLAYEAKWDRSLWDDWNSRMQLLDQVTAELGYGMTALVLADALSERGQLSDYMANLEPRPIVMPAYQSESSCRADIQVREVSAADASRAALESGFGLIFQRRLEVPLADDPDRAYHKAIELVQKDAQYLAARRALFDFEDEVIAKQYPPATALRTLDELVKEQNALVRKAFRQTWLVRVVRIAGIVGPIIPLYLRQPETAAALAVSINAATVRFAQLPPDPNKSPAAIFHRAEKAIAR
jgi:hypothetical protein